MTFLHHSVRSVFPVLLGLVPGFGCAADSLDEPDNARTWATTGSAVAAYASVKDPIAFADGEFSFTDASCPVTSDDGSTVTITGGCTDSEGIRWSGSATIVRTATGGRMLTLDGFGDGNPTSSGTAEIRSAGSSHEFDLNLVREGGMTTTIVYSGTVVGNYQTATTWNGSGTVERDGFLAPTGQVSVTTVDEVMDANICSGQPVSGRTTIVSGDQTAVITYDGATDCDDAHAARFTFNGEDRGFLTGISCSAGALGSRGTTPMAAIFAIGALVLVRGFRRRTPLLQRVRSNRP